MHHANPVGVYQCHRVGMMLECSTGVLLAMAIFNHQDEKGHNRLNHYAVHEGLNIVLSLEPLNHP